jgi:hypothetical protein
MHKKVLNGKVKPEASHVGAPTSAAAGHLDYLMSAPVSQKPKLAISMSELPARGSPNRMALDQSLQRLKSVNVIITVGRPFKTPINVAVS